MENAILLCSGGLDSVVLAYYLKKIKNIENLTLLFLDYNQKSLEQELFCVKQTTQALNAELKIIKLPWLGEISTSLINKQSNQDLENLKPEQEINAWYVPCRNSLFLVIALAIAESELIKNNQKSNIYIGIKYEGELQFKDTTPEFLKQMNQTAKLATQNPDFEFIAPFLNKDKEELIQLSKQLKVPLQHTYSCYIGSDFKDNLPVHCGICAGCKSRIKAFKFSNEKDEGVYGN